MVWVSPIRRKGNSRNSVTRATCVFCKESLVRSFLFSSRYGSEIRRFRIKLFVIYWIMSRNLFLRSFRFWIYFFFSVFICFKNRSFWKDRALSLLYSSLTSYFHRFTLPEVPTLLSVILLSPPSFPPPLVVVSFERPPSKGTVLGTSCYPTSPL